MVFLNDDESNCLRVLAERFSDGETQVFVSPEVLDELGILATNWTVTMRNLEHVGAIRDLFGLHGNIESFHIDPRIVQIVRELDDQFEAKRLAGNAGPDIVAQLQTRARQNPILAWIIIVVLALTAFFSLVNNMWATLERIVGAFK